MTAARNINYLRTNIYRAGRSNSAINMAARAIGADGYTLTSVIRRLNELKDTSVPTVVEISGIENDYISRKADVDRLFSFLSSFSKRNRLVKFTVMIGNMRYVL